VTTLRLSHDGRTALTVRHGVAHGQVVGAAAGRKVVANVAESIGRTRRVDGVVTRVDAVLVHAGTVLWAVGVHAALHTGAAHQWVALIPGATPAGGAVVGAVALGVGHTRISQNTGVDAFSVVTHLVMTALVVRLTAQLNTSNLRVAGVSGLAEADGIVVGHSTLSVGPAVTWADTQPVHTRLFQAAVRVSCASHCCFHRRPALNERVSLEACGTAADGVVALHMTESAAGTVVSCAGVDTTLVHTRAIPWTLVITHTLWHKHWRWNHWQ